MKEVSELVKCSGSVQLITFAIVLFLIGAIVGIVTFQKPDSETTDTERKDSMTAAGVLVSISIIMLIVGIINAIYYGCFKVAIAGTLLSIILL